MIAHVDRHLEHYLGMIHKGWISGTGSERLQVCFFNEKPLEGTVCYATLGLSNHILSMPNGRDVRQELILAVRTEQAHDSLSKLLMYLADFALEGHRAFLRGQVIHLGHPVISGAYCADLYVSAPVLFPEGFEIYRESVPATVFAWLFPISPSEASYVEGCGWVQFEERLEHESVDLFDLRRK